MLDREGPVPVYRQIAEFVHGMIVEGELRPGAAIPSEAQLEARFHVTKTTARRATRELRERGLVHTVRGEGTFVGPPDGPLSPDRAPLYRRVAADLVERIVQGRLPPARAVPGEKAMMREYGIAKATARKVVAQLRAEGWVHTIPHRGSYVVPREQWPKSGG